MRILEITSELDGGGVDRLLYDYCSRMINDIQFDFIVTSDTEGILEKPLRKLGCNVFHVSKIRNGIFKHVEEMSKILKDNNYDIVHEHSGYKGLLSLILAWINGVQVRIAHSHIAYVPEDRKTKLVRKIVTPLTALFVTDFFACGNDAATWMWGERKFKQNKIHIMYNAVDAKAFDYSPDQRIRVRNELGLNDKFVIGDVARFSKQKNHEFLIRVFKEILRIREDSVLLLVGRGELFEEVQQQTREMGIQEKVMFLGIRNDVPALLNAFDLFVLPSLYEGLPVTMVEVQANGLPMVVSESITKEIKINDNVEYYSLDNDEKQWANFILSNKSLVRCKSNFQTSQYNIDVAYNELKDYYLSRCKIRRSK